MSGTFGFTVEEKRFHVLAYLGCVYGTKLQYLREQSVSYPQIRKWRAQMAAGTLEKGLVPRNLGLRAGEPNQELVAMDERVKELEAEVARLKADHKAEIALLQRQAGEDQAGYEERIAQAEGVADALGKAIALLQRLTETQDATEEDSPQLRD